VCHQPEKKCEIKKGPIELPPIALLPLNPAICGSRVLIVDDSMTILRVTARCDSYSAPFFDMLLAPRVHILVNMFR
jgi:hypothetical protein